MKTNFLRLEVVVLVALLMVFSNVAVADIDINRDSILFKTIGDNTPADNPISFEVNQGGDNSSLGTCAMNPMSGAAMNLETLEEFPLPEFPTYFALSMDDNPRFVGTQPASTNIPSEDINRYPPVLRPLETIPATTPEPATLLLMGIGMVGLAPLVRRYRRK
jgi:hypothetical protein